MKNYFIYSAVFILCIQSLVFAKETFECYPMYKITINNEKCEKTSLSAIESTLNKTVITAKDNNYYWTSNNNYKLYKNRKNEFSTYVNPKGAGYIKIRETLDMPYIEHKNYGLKTVTFYGNCK